jgi:hypothetical protein
VPSGKSVVLEVYPAPWSHAFPRDGRNPDQHDAYAAAEWLRRSDLDCGLDRFFNPRVDANEGRVSHDLVCRLAKRRALQNGKEPHDWQTTEKVRTLYKKLDAAELTILLFEAMLLGSVANTNPDKNDDPLTAAATLSKVNVKALRTAVAKEEKTKEHKKAKTLQAKTKSK